MINLMPTPPYDADHFYAMCDELGRLMDAERAREQARLQNRWILGSNISGEDLKEALRRATEAMGSMTGGMSRMAVLTGEAGMRIESFARAIEPNLVYLDESKELSEEDWDRLNKLSWQRRAHASHGAHMNVVSTDGWQMRRLTRWETFLVDVMDASRGKRWLGWAERAALALLMRSK